MKAKQPEYNLRAIYVRSSELTVEEDFDPTIGGQELKGQFRSHPSACAVRTTAVQKVGKKQELLTYDFTTIFGFRYQTPKTDEKGEVVMKIAASVEAEFVCSYERVTSGGPTEEELKEFGKTLVLMHVWPYWREYCSTALQKMHLPAPFIPLLQLKSQPATAKTVAKKKMKNTVAVEAKKPPTRLKGAPKKR